MRTLAFVAAVSLLAASCAESVPAGEHCSTRGLRMMRPLGLPWSHVATTDPSRPVPLDLFDFETFAHASPHGAGLDLEATDGMEERACGVAGAFGGDAAVFEGLRNEYGSDLLLADESLPSDLRNRLASHAASPEELSLLLHGDGEAREADRAMLESRLLAGTKALGGRKGQVGLSLDDGELTPEDLAGTSPRYTEALRKMYEEEQRQQKKKKNHNDNAEDEDEDEDEDLLLSTKGSGDDGYSNSGSDEAGYGSYSSSGSSGSYGGSSSGSSGSSSSGSSGSSSSGALAYINNMQSAVFALASLHFSVPIPAFPPAYLGVMAGTDVVVGPDLRYLSGALSLQVGLQFPPAHPIVKVFLKIGLTARVKGKAENDGQAMTFASLFMINALTVVHDKSKLAADVVKSAAAGMKEAISGTSSPMIPSKILELYTRGFEEEYVDLLGDEWEYVTEGSSPQQGGGSSLPADSVILDAVERIDRMLRVVPKTLGDGSLVWHYTASSTWTSTKLWFKLAKDGSWTWSPDDRNWMAITTTTVRGGQYNGRKPTQNNIETIQALDLIYNKFKHIFGSGPGAGGPAGNSNDDGASGAPEDDPYYDPRCASLGGQCLDSAAGGKCDTDGFAWRTGLCKGPAAVRCCARAAASANDPAEIESASVLEGLVRTDSNQGPADVSDLSAAGNTDTAPAHGTDESGQSITGDALISATARDSPCDCLYGNKPKVGVYDPDAWGDQCRDWDRAGFKWCYVINPRACRDYPVTMSKRYTRYGWRKCGFGVWATRQANTVQRNVQRTVRDTKQWAGEQVDAAAETLDAAKQAASEHIDAAKETISDVADSFSETLDAAGERLVAAAKRTVQQVRTQWREAKRTISETGAFRKFKREWFKGEKKPMRVFAGLAQRMEKEGFSAEDNLLERGLFAADALVFKDYTRVLSIREAVFAFCKKNAGVKGVAERLRNLLSNDESFRAKTKAGRGMPESRVSGINAKGEFTGERQPSPTAEEDAARQPKGTTGFESSTDGVRKEAVQRELGKQNDLSGGSGGELDDADASELYSLIAGELVDRYEHVRSMAGLIAARLRKLGDPTWSSLTAAQRDEYRSYFYKLRELSSGLHRLLTHINEGSGWLARGALKTIDWMEKKSVSGLDVMRADSLARLSRYTGKFYSFGFVDIGFGVEVHAPKMPKMPSVQLEVVYSPAIFGEGKIWSPNKMLDPNYSYGSLFTGHLFEVVGHIGHSASVLFENERRVFTSHDDFCLKRYGKAGPCSEDFTFGLAQLPMIPGLPPRMLVPIFRAIIAGTTINTMVNKQGQDLGEIMGKIFSGRELTKEDWYAVKTMLVNYAPTLGVMAIKSATHSGGLGFASMMYTYKSGDKSGIDSWFVQPFVMAHMDVSKVTNWLKKGLHHPHLTLVLEAGPVVWLKKYGAKYLRNERSQGQQLQLEA